MTRIIFLFAFLTSVSSYWFEDNFDDAILEQDVKTFNIGAILSEPQQILTFVKVGFRF